MQLTYLQATAPDKIYLQVPNECDNISFSTVQHVNWSADKLHESDIEYIKAKPIEGKVLDSEGVADLKLTLQTLIREAKHMRGSIWDDAMKPQREKVDPAIQKAEQMLQLLNQ